MNVEEVDDDSSRKQNSGSINGEIQEYYSDVVFCKFLCETDVGDSCSVSIGKKDAEDHLPPLAPGKSKILEFEDWFCGNKFSMEFVHSTFGGYYLRTGWERYRDEHMLEYGDLLTVYKTGKHNIYGFDEQQYFYVMEYQKLTPEDFQDDRTLIMKQLIATLQDPNSSILVEQMLAKNLRYKHLYDNSNSNGLQLQFPKEEVEENLHDLPLPPLGGEVTLSLFDPIGESVFQMELVHSEKEEYYLGGKGWEEYVANHNLLIFDTIFINKVTVNHDELYSSAECIWEKAIDRNSKLDDQFVSNCYYYEITYQKRATKPQKKPKLGKGVAMIASDDAYWLSCQD
ncbi:hypothetical protein HAX54_004059 [Datura stramonium]|uniref:TF-B3 domain-containing protein n=1 Tax=Datura stramonium TaxID=4076 RepID=A0ABS8T7R7_DATST|nr:hypothetical protein [Datura stramonium]